MENKDFIVGVLSGNQSHGRRKNINMSFFTKNQHMLLNNFTPVLIVYMNTKFVIMKNIMIQLLI